MSSSYANFDSAIYSTIRMLKEYGDEVDTGHWQGVPTEGKPDLVTQELIDVAFRVPMPVGIPGDGWTNGPLNQLREQIKPNLPWADDHFAERVSRVPSNPGSQYFNWPWWKGQSFATQAKVASDDNFKFDHTYQERFWPKQAGRPQGSFEYVDKGNKGIRYTYGDLDDVVGLLLREPHTRQAYLPIFFPEDTGAVHGGRVPCTLGYHFLLRRGALHIWYEIRSCDVVRHFRDDLYLAARLLLWVLDELRERSGIGKPRHGMWHDVTPGTLHFHCFSFHVHKGDMHLL